MARDTFEVHGGRKAGHHSVSQRAAGSKRRLARRVRVLGVALCCALALQPTLIVPGRGSARATSLPRPTEAASESVAGRTLIALAVATASGIRQLLTARESDYRAAPTHAAVYEPEPAALLLGTPSNLSVVGTYDFKIILSWPAVTNAVSYRVERSPNLLTPYSMIGETMPNGFEDTGVSRGHTFLYRVRAIDGTGAVSEPSPVTMATAITFVDPELIGAGDPYNRPATPVKADHVKDLRLAVAAVRSAALLSAPTWQEEVLSGTTPIRAEHVRELRLKLDEARAALGLSVNVYEDTPLNGSPNGTLIKKIHFEQLRDRSTSGVGVTGSGISAYDFGSARLDPANRTGAGGMDLYSGNFNWSLPLVSLPGRAGLDLGLALSYNSLIWTKSGNYVLFDGDWGWPAPGFRLGFAVVQGKFFDTQAQKTAYMLVTSAGSRVSLRQTASPAVYEAGDSSYLQLTEKQDGSLELFATDGTRMTFRAQGGAYKCEEVRDRNGNFINITYNAYGNIQTVNDTLGRAFNFGYYPNGYLEKITQTWHRETETASGVQTVTETHRWAKFEYGDSAVRTNFPGLTVFGPTGGQSFRALKKVSLADDSSFTFDYTSWGQVYHIENRAPSGGLLNYVSLDLPLDETQPQSDCPRAPGRRDWAAYAKGDADGVPAQTEELVTLYEITDGATWLNPEDSQTQVGRLSRMTSPDGTIYKEYAHAVGWDKGLARLTEVWSGGMRKKWTSTAWTQDDEVVQYLRNPRVRETNVYDSNEDGSLHSRRRTEVSYIFWGLPEDVREYDTDGTVLRRTHTVYKASSVDGDGAYVLRRIIGLPEKREVYGRDGGQEKLFSKITFEYDLGGEFLTVPEGNPTSVIQHDSAHFGVGLTLRGNLCRTRRWDVSDAGNQSKSVATEVGYNTVGAAVFTRDPLGHRTNAAYADTDGGMRFAYPTTVTDPDGFTFSAWYNYDLGAVTKTVTPTPHGASGQPVVTRFYDAAGRPLKASNGPGGTYTRWEYAASGLYVRQLTKLDTDKPETFVINVTDGTGRAVGALREHPGEGTGYAASRTEYDPVNRIVKQYNPAEVSVDPGDLSNARAWVPAGPDATPPGQEWPSSATEYDWKGRVRREVNADGTDRLTEYNGCGCAGGEVVTLKGELVPSHDSSGFVRRMQRVYHDILGRPRKSEVLTWDGGVYSATTTRYNALDQVVRVREYAGAAPEPDQEPAGEGSGYQTTTLTYDGHGRLKTRHLPKYDANTVTTYDYDADDTVQSVTDPRGVVTTYGFTNAAGYTNKRHLVNSVTYGNAPTGVPVPTQVRFEYDGAGNRTQMTDEAGSVSYQFDTLSRLASETRQFNGLTHRTYSLTYNYNLIGQLTSMTDPFGVVTSYNRDETGQVTAVTGSGYAAIPQLASGVQFASGLKYRAWGALRAASYGDGRGLTTDYDKRLRITGFHMPGPVSMDKAYQYEESGALRLADDLVEDIFDRSYSFDHAGRLTEAHTGAQAHGGQTDDGPYQQTYSYDPFGHSAGQTNVLWQQPVGGGGGQYQNDRRQGWNYDAAGNLTYDQLRHYVNDAAGRMRSFDSGTQTYAYDGEGRVARVTRQLEGTSVVYNLRSTALGGAVVSQLKPQANALDVRQDIIPLGDGAEVRRDVEVTGERVTWSHEDPAGTTVQEGGVTSFGGPNATFYNPVVQLDPVGASVGWANPAQFEEPPPPPDETSPEGRVYNNPLRPGTVCFNNFMRVDCEQLLLVISSRTGRRQVAGVEYRLKRDYGSRLTYGDPHTTPAVDNEEVVTINSNEVSLWRLEETTVISTGFVRNSFVVGAVAAKQNPRGLIPVGKAKLDLERFRACLRRLFLTEIAPSDGRSRGYDIRQGKFIGFFGKSGSPFTVTIDSTSKTLEQVRSETKNPDAIAFSDGKAVNYHGTVYIAREYAQTAAPVAIEAAQVHEIGNKIWDLFAGYFPQPHASPRAQRFGKDNDAGIALEECTFGGLVTKDGTLVR